MNVQSAQTTRKEMQMKREVDWVLFNDGTKICVGVRDVVKIIYHEGHTHYVDVIFDNGEVHRCFGIDEIKFKEALYFE